MVKRSIVIIPGDGIGPEVLEATINVLEALQDHVKGLSFNFVKVEAGLKYWEKTGKQIDEEAIEEAKKHEAILKGPTETPFGPGTYRSVAVTLRKALDLYANVRPFKSMVGVKSLHQNVDFILVRENTEGLYSGLEYRVQGSAIGIRVISERCSERITRFAFELARREGRRRVTAVHKANVLKETCGLFRNTFLKVAKEYPDIAYDELLVDAAAYTIVTRPQSLDVLVTTNLFGDILSDVAAGVCGGLGIAPSANIGDRYAMFEPVHGTASKYAGRGVANPMGMMFSALMMLKHLGEREAAVKLEKALNLVLKEGRVITRDLGGSASTMEVAKEVVRKLGD
ncbi:MAG: isocitrate/isopropylmalate dehydrogenase family protein [Candidatus Nezhaarchaeales archaeon]